MRLDEPRQAGQVVAAFEDRQDAPAADLGGQLAAARLPQLGEALLGDPHAAQRIALPGVEAGREQQDLGREARAGPAGPRPWIASA